MEEKVFRPEKELEERREKGEEDDEEGMGQVGTPTPFIGTLSPHYPKNNLLSPLLTRVAAILV